MFQFPMLGSALHGLSTGGQADTAAPDAGLALLMPGIDGELAGFSAELQAMLMQLSPAMLQRLEQLLAGGTALPQAATTVLSEFAGGADGDGAFPDLLRQLGGGDRAPTTTPAVGSERSAALAGGTPPLPEVHVLAQTLPNAASMVAEQLQLQSPALLPTQASSATTTVLSPQLASSLLDMGVPQPVNSRAWPDAVAERVAWMLQGDQQFARLKLNPPNLGPLEVRVSVSQDQTQVAFLAQHAGAREALEAALPRLREMFDQASLQLVRADVADPGTGQGEAAGDDTAWPGGGPAGWGGEGTTDGSVVESEAPVLSNHGLVDLFA